MPSIVENVRWLVFADGTNPRPLAVRGGITVQACHLWEPGSPLPEPPPAPPRPEPAPEAGAGASTHRGAGRAGRRRRLAGTTRTASRPSFPRWAVLHTRPRGAIFPRGAPGRARGRAKPRGRGRPPGDATWPAGARGAPDPQLRRGAARPGDSGAGPRPGDLQAGPPAGRGCDALHPAGSESSPWSRARSHPEELEALLSNCSWH